MRKNLFIPKVGSQHKFTDVATDDVNVLFLYDGERKYAHPVRLFWKGREFKLGIVQFWHTTSNNGVNVHHYTISDVDDEFTFLLAVETDNLTWTLESYAEHEEKGARQPIFRPKLIGGYA